jgi:cytochrome b561
MPDSTVLVGEEHRLRAGSRRYDAVAQGLHWVTALLMFTIIPIAWHMVLLGRTDPSRETWVTVHKSIGVTIFALAVARLIWRARHPAPALDARLGQAMAAGAVASHWLLYFILIAMPASGYVLSTAGGHPVSYFGLFTLPGLPQNHELAVIGTRVHLLGQWAVYAFIGLHLMATAWHVGLRRDGTLDRMLPPQTNAPS